MYTPLPHSHTHNTLSHRLHTARNTSHTQHTPHAPSHATHSLITYTQHICTTLTHTQTYITYTSHSPALSCTLTHSPLALWVVYLPLHLHSGPLSLPTTSLPHCVLSSKASSSAPAFPQPQVSPRDGMCKSRAQETLKGLCPVPWGWRGLSDLGGGHHCETEPHFPGTMSSATLTGLLGNERGSGLPTGPQLSPEQRLYLVLYAGLRY